MDTPNKEQKIRRYLVASLLGKGEDDPAKGLLGSAESYQEAMELRVQIAQAEDQLCQAVERLNDRLENEWMMAAAQAFAKKKNLRAGKCFQFDDSGKLWLICNPIERKVSRPYVLKVPTMDALRQRGRDMGIDVDALGLGAQRRKIAAHLDAVQQADATGTKMARTGDAVPVTVVG